MLSWRWFYAIVPHPSEKIIKQACVGLVLRIEKTIHFFADSIILCCFSLVHFLFTSQWASMSKDNNKRLLYQSPAFSIPSKNIHGNITDCKCTK